MVLKGLVLGQGFSSPASAKGLWLGGKAQQRRRRRRLLLECLSRAVLVALEPVGWEDGKGERKKRPFGILWDFSPFLALTLLPFLLSPRNNREQKS